MNSFRARRATTDDVPQLLELWRADRLPADDFEKRFTEFQVIADQEGKILAAIGIEISNGQGKLYGETFLDFALTDTLRPAMWDRLKLILPNLGLFRIWTREEAPFWKKSAEFSEAPRDVLPKLPPAFGTPQVGWLILQLRDEATSPESVDKVFAQIHESERGRTEKFRRNARAVKAGTTVFCLGLFFIAIYCLIHVLRHR